MDIRSHIALGLLI